MLDNMNYNDIKFLSDKLNDFVSKHKIPLGLQNGKMGLCIYIISYIDIWVLNPIK